MYKVSVIMPIYNAEEYLENTLNSVINQTIGFENIELIIVDDKSIDSSKNILKNYSKKYSNIKPIFLDENSGCPGIPRNIGIKNATSDYIMFIDDDDEYFPEICEKLYTTILSEKADIGVCDCLVTDNLGSVKWTINSDELVLDNEITYFSNTLVWRCIFKKSTILNNNISFPAINIGEDAIFILNYYIHSKKLVYLKDFVGYHHIDRKDSISLTSLDFVISNIKSYDLLVKHLRAGKVDYDLNRFFRGRIQSTIRRAIILGNYDDTKKALSYLSNFEMKINFKGKLSIFYKFINLFILHGKLNIATYMCLFISKFRKSNLILNIYRKFFF